MTPAPLVSVLMTVYNGERFLRQTVSSILDQTYAPFEVWVTDDGSQDGTWAILSEFAAKDPRVQLIRNQQNLGVPRSMNRLFGLANGPYVTRHDADDLSHPERLARQVAFLESHAEVGVLGTRVQFIDADGNALDVNYFTSKTCNDDIQAELLRSNCLCQGSVMFRRQLLDQAGLYDESNIGSEDYDLWLRLAEITQVAVLDAVLYQYRIHPDSVSHRRRYVQAYHAARALEQALQRRHGAAAPAEQREVVAQYYLQAAVTAFLAGDAPAARDYARCAAQAYPTVFENTAALTPALLPQFTALGTDRAVRMVEALFAGCLPSTRALARLRSLWLADIHMQAVFRDRQRMPRREWRRHLWLGIKHRPAWLFNRGVLVLLATGWATG